MHSLSWCKGDELQSGSEVLKEDCFAACLARRENPQIQRCNLKSGFLCKAGLQLIPSKRLCGIAEFSSVCSWIDNVFAMR